MRNLIIILAFALISTACAGEQIPGAAAEAETIPPTVATSTTTLPSTTTTSTSMTSTTVPPETTTTTVVEVSCPPVAPEELKSFLFINTEESPREPGVIHGPFEEASDSRDFVQSRVLFAAVLCDPYQGDEGAEEGQWFLPIYFGDKPNGERVIGTYILGADDVGVEIAVSSSPNHFMGFDPTARNSLPHGSLDFIPLDEFLDSINHDWMYPVVLTIEDLVGYRPEGCEGDPRCTAIWDYIYTHYEYNRSLYEAIEGLGDVPADGEFTNMASVVIYRALQLGVYGSDA